MMMMITLKMVVMMMTLTLEMLKRRITRKRDLQSLFDFFNLIPTLAITFCVHRRKNTFFCIHDDTNPCIDQSAAVGSQDFVKRLMINGLQIQIVFIHSF